MSESRDDSEAVFGQAVGLYQAGRLQEAEDRFRQLLALRPDRPDALHYLGVCAYRRGADEQAAAHVRAALKTDPAQPFPHNTLALILKKQRKPAEALRSVDAAIELAPGQAIFHNTRGLILAQMQRLDEALTAFARAASLRTDFVEVYSNLGKTLTELGRPQEALAYLERAAGMRPDLAEIRSNLAAAQRELHRYDEALANCERALASAPDFPYLAGFRLHDLQHACAWDSFEQASRAVVAQIDSNAKAAYPFAALAIPTTPAQQLRCAQTYVQDKYPLEPSPLWQGERYSHDRIRIGYFSADFHDHATSHLLAGLLERHDRTRFEIVGFSFGPARQDAWRRRLESACERFIDMAGRTDDEIAAAARQAEIDIAVDLKGFTLDARTGIFARRPAPIQVNYLGFPGTMGAEYMDYLIADPVVIPPEHRVHYSEKIVHLPHSYQVNDSAKRIDDSPVRRSDHGLPEDCFVFCCFNNNYKITPELFDIWMRLLQKVESSVLWLFGDNPVAEANLRREAEKRTVSPERLIFAPRLALDKHLARHRLADLFLDTFHYNAHTTASDALWSGLPIVTCLGGAFAGRVAASLLSAVGLPELIACDPAEYETLALALATDPERLAGLREKLARNRDSQPLFDTGLFARHIEMAYAKMWERWQAGQPPEHISLA